MNPKTLIDMMRSLNTWKGLPASEKGRGCRSAWQQLWDWAELQETGQICECGYEKVYHYSEDCGGSNKGVGHCEGSVPLCPYTEFIAKE